MAQDFETTEELENRAEDVRKVCDQMVDEVGEERRMYTRLRYTHAHSTTGSGSGSLGIFLFTYNSAGFLFFYGNQI